MLTHIFCALFQQQVRSLFGRLLCNIAMTVSLTDIVVRDAQVIVGVHLLEAIAHKISVILIKCTDPMELNRFHEYT
ncbi:MAG: hypothetical protein N2235_13515 [Fischerella sp.]|nr:hypothetical protein [Fischerella sp.]